MQDGRLCCWVSEVRTDIKQVVSVINAMAHMADERVLAATNRVCHYLIATMNEGPTFGGCTEADLGRPPTVPPQPSHEVDVDGAQRL